MNMANILYIDKKTNKHALNVILFCFFQVSILKSGETFYYGLLIYCSFCWCWQPQPVQRRITQTDLMTLQERLCDDQCLYIAGFVPNHLVNMCMYMVIYMSQGQL